MWSRGSRRVSKNTGKGLDSPRDRKIYPKEIAVHNFGPFYRVDPLLSSSDSTFIVNKREVVVGPLLDTKRERGRREI